MLAWWDGERYEEHAGRLVAPDRLFGPRVIGALTPDGHAAVGDGVEYCIHVRPLARGAFRRACRIRAPVPVGDAVRDPDLSRIEDEARREALANVVRRQEIGDRLPSFDRLLLDGEGQLWVRTLGPESADLHPYLRRDMPEREPAYRMWDVFDVVGRLIGAVEVPSSFEPQVVVSGRIFGFLELTSGEIAIGAVAVPLAEDARDGGG